MTIKKITETTTSYHDAELVMSTFSPILDPADLQMASLTKGKLALPGNIHLSIHLFNTYPVPCVPADTAGTRISEKALE